MIRPLSLFLVLLAILGSCAAETPRDVAPWSLYTFDNGLNGPDVPTVEAKVALLKKLGYAGMITRTAHLAKLPELLEALDRHGLELAGIYHVFPLEGKLDTALRDAIPLLTGRHVRIEVGFTSKKFKPSDAAGDALALEHLKLLASWCAGTNVEISFYPHFGFWNERVDDGIRLAKKANIPILGTHINLYHWMVVTPQRPLAELLVDAMPYLKAVTINGMDTTKGNQIVSLKDGDYDVGAFLATIRKAGYQGPIGLQCYNLKGPSENHLAQSMERWKELRAQVLAVTK